MKFNKRCLTVFSEEKPFMAMGTKSKLFDTSFSLTSELFLYDYSLGVQYPSLQTDNKFYKLKWCNWGDGEILATGNEDGKVTLYTPAPEKNVSFELLSSCCVLEGDVLGLDFNASKGVLAAGSSNGKIIFWNLNKLDSQYTSDIPLTSNITCLSWNKKVSRILCAGTDDGKILILDARAKNVAMTLGGDGIVSVSDVMWHPNGSTSILAATNLGGLQCFNLSSDSTSQIGDHGSGLIRLSVIGKDRMAASSKNQIDIIEVGDGKIVDTIPVDGIFEVSFSKRDPLMALSYVGGTTEILPRITTDILPVNPGCIVGNSVVGKEVYEIEYEEMKDIEEDAFIGKIKKLLYPDGSYNIDRKGLGELLLAEAIRKSDSETSDTAEGLNEKISDMNLGLRLDLKDPLTLALIKGDLEDAYTESMKSNRSVSFSQFLALAKGSGSLPFDSDDPLILLSTAQITSTYSHLLEKISTTQWLALLSIISFSPLSNEDFFSNAIELSNKLDNEGKLLIYAMTNHLDKYFRLKESMYRMPTSVYDVRDFFQEYKGMIVDLESMGRFYKSSMISEYFWYASAHGEAPVRIKYEDLGINIYLGRTNNNVLSIKKPGSTPTNDIQNRPSEVLKRSPVLESLARQDSNTIGCYGAPPIKPNSVISRPPSFSGQSESSSGVVGSLSRPNIPGVNNNFAHRSTVQSPPSPMIHQQSSKAISPTLGSGRPSHSSNHQENQQKMYIPRPGYRTVPSTPTYNSGPKPASSKTYSSMPDISNLSSSTPPVSTYGMMSRGSHGSLPQSSTSKPYIPRPGMPSSPSLSTQDQQQKPIIPTPRPQRKEDTQLAPQTQDSSSQKKTDDLNPEDVLNTFEDIIKKLIERASAKANLIVRNKLKEVTKRFSIYNSVTRDTFSPLILRGIDRINNEIKNDADSDRMKQKIREIVLECTETGENRADLWMPSVYTLLQIVYH
ncbi:WD40 domain-containing Sec31-like protein [Encephalitozoon romaleae SJ-2008]|uniref:Protein transport protein SEC31 n=1 Tax=Encephalitozoon romaleae (strain SJ-2008) TaxID=1178016 RepID=I6ZUP8_ENCRO|nr:WD40 domain-containing Sec31-like protein [Encephalitozoon romaleae SJ-2008]AFN83436.1 WD40 domain-containing Sec31-like protein [Encephalitozoon romaleae SJ-2008]